MTWNIWHGKYLPEVIKYLRQEAPDIIALQEVIEQNRESKQYNMAKHLAAELKYNFTYFMAFHTDRHKPEYDQGNAILCRYPILSSEVLELSSLAEYEGSATTEPRIAVRAVVNVNNKVVNVVNTHLGYSHELVPTEIRDRQLEKLKTFLQRKKTILLADLNSTPESNTVRKISEILISADGNLNKKTWSVYKNNYHNFVVDGLEYRIDYIFTSEDIKVLHSGLGDTKASDHLPVISVMDI